MPKAVVAHEFGGPESLVLEDRPELVPGPGEIVIDVRAAALNRRDLRVVAGGWPGVRRRSCRVRTGPASCARSVREWAATARATRCS